MDLTELEGIVESVLFACGEPVSVYRLCELSGAEKSTVTSVLTRLGDRISEHMRGISLLRLEDKYQLCTREEYGAYVRRALDNRRQTSLSQAALEVLAITAYNQPVTKAYIEQVRGVDCSGVLETLREKGLIEERGRLDAPGKPLLYGTTTDFLRVFDMSSLDELPELPKAESQEDGEAPEGFELPEDTSETDRDVPDDGPRDMAGCALSAEEPAAVSG